MRRAFLVAFILTLLATATFGAAAPQPAAAAAEKIWEEGTSGHSFHLAQATGIDVLGTDDQSLQLERKTLVEIGPDAPMWDGWPKPDPRMAFPLATGHVIISGGHAPVVKEVDAAGNVVWQYENGKDGVLYRPWSAEPATFAGRQCILISDRGLDAARPPRVFAVSWDAKETVWQYGGAVGRGVNQLADPFCATQITPNGNVLIADSNDNHRVIEVRASDYDPNDPSPDMGYSADSIVWQYGVTGQAGAGPGHLWQARSPQRLPSGDTLITDPDSDSGRTPRIICVKAGYYDPAKPDNGYTADSIRWQYVSGVDGPLDDPNTARYVATGPLAGTILVSDAKAQGVEAITFDAAKQTTYSLDTATYERPADLDSTDSSSPRDARIGPDGALWIADAGFHRVLEIGNEGMGTAQSQWLDCGYPTMVKAFDRIKISSPAPLTGKNFQFWYGRDGVAFVKAKVSADGKNINLPGGVWGTKFAYKVVLKSDDRWATPVLDSLVIHFMKAKTGTSHVGGGSSKPGGSGNSGQSGSYTYPSTAEGGTGTSGTGTGSGSYGTGTGSGSYGTGTGSAAAGAGSGSVANSVEVPIQSTGSGDAQAIQGYQVQGEEGVSGVPLRAEQGPQAPEPARPGPEVPVVALVAAGLVVAAAFFFPWPFVAVHLRRLTGFDHTRPAHFLPFRPLGK